MKKEDNWQIVISSDNDKLFNIKIKQMILTFLKIPLFSLPLSSFSQCWPYSVDMAWIYKNNKEYDKAIPQDIQDITCLLEILFIRSKVWHILLAYILCWVYYTLGTPDLPVPEIAFMVRLHYRLNSRCEWFLLTLH